MHHPDNRRQRISVSATGNIGATLVGVDGDVLETLSQRLSHPSTNTAPFRSHVPAVVLIFSRVSNQRPQAGERDPPERHWAAFLHCLASQAAHSAQAVGQLGIQHAQEGLRPRGCEQ